MRWAATLQRDERGTAKFEVCFLVPALGFWVRTLRNKERTLLSRWHRCEGAHRQRRLDASCDLRVIFKRRARDDSDCFLSVEECEADVTERPLLVAAGTAFCHDGGDAEMR
jgi:hypothetical protein